MTAIVDKSREDENSKMLMRSLAMLESAVDRLNQAVVELSQRLGYVCLPQEPQVAEANLAGLEVSAPLIEAINKHTNLLTLLAGVLLDIERRCVLPLPSKPDRG